MRSLTNTRTFAKHYKEILQLQPEQISQLDKLELKLYKDYRWNYTVSQKQMTFAFIRVLLSTLSQEQISLLKVYREESRIRKQKREEERIEQLYHFQLTRLKFIDFEPKQLQAIAKKLSKLSKFVEAKKRSIGFKNRLNFNEIKDLIYQDEIFPLMNSKQIAEFKNLELSEEKTRKENRLKQSKNIFKLDKGIELSDLQASLIFSEENEIPSKNNLGEYYSPFEKAKLELEKFKQILNPKQFSHYLPIHKEYIKNIEKDIVDSDNKHNKLQLSVTKEYLQYYRTEVLPSICHIRSKIENRLSEKQKELIEKIRIKYYDQLNKKVSESIASHIKHNRNLAPNELERILVKSNLNRISPNYCYVKDMVEVRELLNESLQNIIVEFKKELKPIYGKAKEFQIESFERNGGTYGGSVLKLPIKKDEKYLNHIGILIIEPIFENNIAKLEVR